MPTNDDGDMPSLEEQAGTLVAQTLTAAAVEEMPTETPTNNQESAQINATDTNACCLEMRANNFKTSNCSWY